MQEVKQRSCCIVQMAEEVAGAQATRYVSRSMFCFVLTLEVDIKGL